MDTTLDACPSSPPALLRPSSSERLEFSSSPPLDTPRQALLPTTPTPRPRGTAADFIQADWTLWGRQERGQWPGFERYAGRQDTRAWWQDYGYRVEDRSTRRLGNRLRWICADCFARGFKKKSAFSFVCSTGISIKKHLRESHGIVGPGVAPCRRGEEGLRNQAITRFMGADLTNPNDQFLLGKLRSHFSLKGLRMLLLDWITYHNLPFQTVHSERFQRILLYGNPLLERGHIPSAKMLLRMLESEYRGAVGPATEVLRSARSQIHFSFDGWTSKQYSSFLGINAQFVDRDFAQHRVLLGLRPLRGRHTGLSLADEVADTLAFWQIEGPDRVGYFTLDNAASNDACIKALAAEHGFCPEERRVRCAGHIFNLCVRAMLYGSKGEDFGAIIRADGDDEEEEDIEDRLDHAVDEALRDEGEEGTDGATAGVEMDVVEDFASAHPAPDEINDMTFLEYSQHGAPGMLHNIGVQLRTSPQLYEQFLQSQRKESGKASTLNWVFNNATRWDSDMRMMERALLLRPALNTFFNDVQNRWESEGGAERARPAILQYRLSSYDWRVIEVLVKLLKPYAIASKQLQGNGVPGERSTCGGFDEYFPVVEMLLDYLESAIEGTVYDEVDDAATGTRKDVEWAVYEGLDRRTRRLLKVFIKLGWKKLHQYYDLLTGAAYVGAVVFNPAKKWRLLDLLWSRVPSQKAKGWRCDYERRLLEIWDAYREREIDNTVVQSADAPMDYIERRLARSVTGLVGTPDSGPAAPSRYRGGRKAKQGPGMAMDDEYARYCAEDTVNSHHYRSRPINWWKINAGRYPRLSVMAVDMLSIPSSSAESERTFSSAGRMMGPLRNRMRREIVAMAQCVRSWSQAGLYRPSLPLLSVDDERWVDALASIQDMQDIEDE